MYEDSITHLSENFIRKILEVQENFLKKPDDVAMMVYSLSDALQKLGVDIIRTFFETIDQWLCNSPRRKEKYYIEQHMAKQLITSLGTVNFNKTLFSDKECRNEMYCIFDQILGLEQHQRMTPDAVCNVLKEAAESSYRKGGSKVNPSDEISPTAVKDLIHGLQFPPNFNVPVQKKVVDYLYIDADEDHAHLQFQEKKGDLDVSESGRKKNGVITKLIYVYEGVRPVAPKSKRHRLIGTHYFCRCTEDNKALWDEVYEYIDTHYDLSKVKKVYLNADGGPWIKSGINRLHGVEYVLDEFHLSKYLLKMTGHMKDTQEDAKIELCKAIRSKEKADFIEIRERLMDCTTDEKVLKRIEESAQYILDNWTAAKRRLKHRDAIYGCSAEGHVYHVLSSRMSTLAMGWSRKGVAKMAQLREWYYNKRDFLELAKYQQKEENIKKAAGAEELVLSAKDMRVAERAGRSIYEMELGKYSDAISHTWTLQTKKQMQFYLNHYIY